MILKVTKSIDFTMLVVRVWLFFNSFDLITPLKTMIMTTIKKINWIRLKELIMNFIKSIVLGVALVRKMV